MPWVGARAFAEEALVLHLLAHNTSGHIDLLTPDDRLHAWCKSAVPMETAQVHAATMVHKHKHATHGSAAHSAAQVLVRACLGPTAFTCTGSYEGRTMWLPARACLATTDARRPSI